MCFWLRIFKYWTFLMALGDSSDTRQTCRTSYTFLVIQARLLNEIKALKLLLLLLED